ncbi:hypothetical protein GCM10023154_17550 [Advenella faeciporci]|nr:hypothetical protein [Advenella faeciporci]
MIEIAGLILALASIVFAFETPRNAFLKLVGVGKHKKDHATRLNVRVAPAQAHELTSLVFGATQSGRHPFFIEEPNSSLNEALSLSKDTGMPIFLVIYDESHPSQSKLYYSLGCFMDYYTTKRLVQDHFIVVLAPKSDKDAASLVPSDDPLENCLWVVLDLDGKIIRREGVYANADEGLKRVRSVVASISEA